MSFCAILFLLLCLVAVRAAPLPPLRTTASPVAPPPVPAAEPNALIPHVPVGRGQELATWVAEKADHLGFAWRQNSRQVQATLFQYPNLRLLLVVAVVVLMCAAAYTMLWTPLMAGFSLRPGRPVLLGAAAIILSLGVAWIAL